MAITSLNELWGKKWALAENPTALGGDYGQSYLKLNPAPSAPLRIAAYNYNYFNSDELYVEASTGNFLTFWGKHSSIHAYGIPWGNSTVTSFLIRSSTAWVEPKGATPRLMEFIPQPSGYSFEENALIVEFWNNNFVEVDEVVIDVKEEYEKLFESIGNSIRNKTGGSSKIYPASMPTEIGKIGNSGASGTITITTNGTHDVAAYASADVNVPTGITPEGKLSITTNGDHDVTNYATASVNVPNVIPEGYIIPAGTLEITENGTYDAAEYASVNVNVASSGGGDTSMEDVLIEGTLTNYTNDRVTKIGNYSFYYNSNLQSISCANVTSIGESALRQTTALKTVNFPKLKTIGEYGMGQSGITNFESDTVTSLGKNTFYYAKLETVHLPNVTIIPNGCFNYCTALKSIGSEDLPNVTEVSQYGMSNCTSLKSVSLPAVTKINSYSFSDNASLESVDLPELQVIYDTNAFYNCRKLKKAIFKKLGTMSNCSSTFMNCNKLEIADLGTPITIGNSTLYNCYSLKTLVLRKTEAVTTIPSSTNVLYNAYHFHGTTNSTYNPTGAKDGYIYVPRDLIASYQAATNWSTFATQFRALEDYTVDGTTTGDFDETKI